MSCRTTPAGSAITSFSRICDGPGSPLSDVATLSLFHELRRDFDRASHRFYFWQGEDEMTRMNRLFDHELRGETREEIYANILQRYRTEIEQDETLTDARRASLLARLDAAATADTPDDQTLYALARMREETISRREAYHHFITEAAETLGQDYNTLHQRFVELENSIDRSRNAADPETYTEDNRRRAEQLGLSTEAGSVHAFSIIREEARQARNAELQARPARIAEYTPVRKGKVPDSDYEVIAYGVDAPTGYIEFQVKNTTSGEIETIGYRSSFSAEDVKRGLAGEYTTWRWNDGSHRSVAMSPGEFYHDYFSNRGWSTFRDEDERLEASRAPRCARCGQWANNVHTCPAPLTDAPTYILSSRMMSENIRTSSQRINYAFTNSEGAERNGELSIDLPLVADYRRLFKDNGSLLIRNVQAYSDWQDRESAGRFGHSSNSLIKGDVFIKRLEDGTIVADIDSLKCSCSEYKTNNYRCRHTRAVGDAAIKRSIPPQRAAASLTPAEREQRAALRQQRYEAINATNWAENEAYAADMRKSWKANSEISYSEDFDSFYTLYNSLNEQKAAKGKLTLPYKTENALNGLATRESGQAFGVEIEYDFPEGMGHAEKQAAQEKIGKALYAANLTPVKTQQRYHSAASNGYKDTHVDENGKGTWSWETDATVAGEIVTPMMYDEPETWEKLDKVLTILKDNGAVPSTRAGAHVHVGTSKFGKDPSKYAQLARMAGQHEDVLYRVAADPSRGEHRGKDTRFGYVSPLRKVPVSGFNDATDIRRWGSRTNLLNLQGARADDEYKKSHVEFRIFDSTLDAGAMQQQIKLAVSMTDAANRVSHKGGTNIVKESVGDHAERLKQRGRRKPKKEDIASETATFRSFLDTLYQSKEDKDNLTRLFVNNSWLKLTPGTRRRFGLEPNS